MRGMGGGELELGESGGRERGEGGDRKGVPTTGMESRDKEIVDEARGRIERCPCEIYTNKERRHKEG